VELVVFMNTPWRWTGVIFGFCSAPAATDSGDSGGGGDERNSLVYT